MMIIRLEIPQDYSAIYAVNKLAFDGRDNEPRLVEALRQSDGFIPQLSLVAERRGEIVGHILFSPIAIETDSGNLPAVALAPLAVLPEHQNQGIGSALVRRGLAECARLGHAIVIVLGHPNYYPRFGFSAASASGLTCPFGDCGQAWMALVLQPGALDGVRGAVKYPPPFAHV